MHDKKHLLLVEDDSTLGYLLSEYLKMNAFSVTWVKDGKTALHEIDKQLLELIILDVKLPDMDGFELAKLINGLNTKVPFLFLTARSLKIDVLKGFAVGAVDYLKKPIDEEELVVRIQTLLARLHPIAEEIRKPDNVHLGSYVLHREQQELKRGGQVQKLTHRETDLLAYLAMHKNELCSHKDILLTLWGKNDYFNKKSLNVFISRLRKYLQEDPTIQIENIHRRGFILKEEKS